ncbi:hypothetical protein MTO96_018402 [Rhipicephalus appendiculatus]
MTIHKALHFQKTSRGANGRSAEIEAFLGGQTLPATALAISVVASVANGVNVVSFVGHFYAHGFHTSWVVAGTLFASTLTATAVVPLLYGLRVASIFQYLRLRFDNKVGITACLVYFVLSVVYDSSHVTPPLRPITDFNITEYMFRMNMDITSDDTFWSCLIGGLPYIVVRMGFDQMVVQRYMAARTLRAAKIIAVAGAAFVVLFFLLVTISAAYIIYWYRDCDPFVRGDISNYDQLFLSLYASASGPFAGLILLAISSPWVNAKGAAWSSMAVCLLQLWHAVGKSFFTEPLAPVFVGTLDRCPLVEKNSSIGIENLGATPDSVLTSRSQVFPLYQLSFFWSSFIGGVKTCHDNLSFTSPLFLNLWRRFKFFANMVQVEKEAKNGGVTLLHNDEDVGEKTGCGTEMSFLQEEKYIFKENWHPHISLPAATLTMHPTKDLDIYDCVVFGVLTVVGYLKTPRCGNGTDAEIEAFLGGQTLPAAALAMSVVASVANGMNVVSFVGHYYAHGFHSIWVLAGTLFASTLTVTAVVPLLYGLRVASIFQGGLRGVVWADCVQALVMFLAPITIIAKVVYDSNRVTPTLRSITDMNVTEYMFRIAITGAAFVLFFFLLIAIAAVYIIQWYRDCDPYVRGDISSYDQIVPYYIKQSLSGVATLRGLFLAGLLGATTSIRKRNHNDHVCYRCSNDGHSLAVVPFAVCISLGSLRWAHPARYIFSVGQCKRRFLGKFGGLFAPALARRWEKFFHRGARTGVFGSEVFPLYELSFFWSSFIGALLTMVLGTALSILTGGVETCKGNLSLTSPFFLNLWRRFKFLGEMIQIDKEATNGGVTLLRNDEDVDEKTSHGTEITNCKEHKYIFKAGQLTTGICNEVSL